MADFRRYLADGMVTNEAVVAYVDNLRKASEDEFGTFFRTTKKRYDFYRGRGMGNFPSFRNNVHIPLLFSYIWVDVAFKVQTMFGSYPFVEFSPTASGPAAVAAKHKNDALISQQLLDDQIVEKATDFFSSADIYGTAFARVGWDYRERTRIYRRNIMGQQVRVPARVVERDDPTLQVLDILDVLPQPGRKRISECDWVIVRYFMDLDTILEDQASSQPPWDAQGVQRLMEEPNAEVTETRYYDRAGIYRNFSQWKAQRDTRYGKPVEMWEFWGNVPGELAIDGTRNVVITIANGRHVMRYEPTPYDHGRIPIVGYSPMPDPHFIHGTGKVEVGEKLQVAIDRIMNQRLDALDVAIDGKYLAKDTLGLPDNLISRAGKVFKVMDNISSETFQPIPFDLSGVQIAAQEIEFLGKYAQQGTAVIDDVVSGIQSGNRTTAREYLGRRESSKGRLLLEAMLAEYAFLSPAAEQMMFLNQQFLPVPRQVERVGMLAFMNPMTGQPLPPEPQLITVEDLNTVYRPRAMGTMRMVSKSMRLQDLILVSQEVKSNPVGLMIFNWYAFFQELLRTTDLDPAELLVSTVPAINMYGGMGMMGGGGEGEDGQPTSDLESLSPQLLGANSGGNQLGASY